MAGRRAARWCLSGLAVLVLSERAAAVVLEVCPTGGCAYTTIKTAVTAASDGDSVLLHDGLYVGPNNVNINYHGKSITVASLSGNPEACVIDCESELYGGRRGFAFETGEGPGAVLAGVTIRNGLQRGGGIYCEGSSPRILNCILEANRAEGDYLRSFGGGMMCYEASPTIEDCVFIGNSATYGGGIACQHSAAQIVGCEFVGNSGGWGGAGYAYFDSGTTIDTCVIRGNHASSGAGLYFHYAPDIVVSNSILVENVASLGGGGIRCDGDANALIQSCLIASNSAAEYGGGVSSFHASPSIVQCTLVGNYSGLHGSGLSTSSEGTVSLRNSIVALNSGSVGIHGVGTTVVEVICTDVYGHELGNYGGVLSDQTGINGNISADPLFCDLGGADYTLDGESPCLPDNNDCGVQMGAFGEGCDLTAVGAPAPAGVVLEANYPNPFNPSTTIPFSLGAPSAVTLTIHDLSGRLVRVIADARSFPSGRHELLWNGLDTAGRPAPSGVYFYRLETAAGATARPMLLVK